MIFDFTSIVEIVQAICLIISAVLIVITAIGVLRVDDDMKNVIYARIHILGIVDIAGVLAMIGLGQFLLAAIYFVLAPVVSHAMANAYYYGEDPNTKASDIQNHIKNNINFKNNFDNNSFDNNSNYNNINKSNINKSYTNKTNTNKSDTNKNNTNNTKNVEYTIKNNVNINARSNTENNSLKEESIGNQEDKYIISKLNLLEDENLIYNHSKQDKLIQNDERAGND